MEENLKNQKKITVRTMAKDIAKLREMAVELEREKIMKMKPEEEIKKAREEKEKKERELLLAKEKEELKKKEEELKRAEELKKEEIRREKLKEFLEKFKAPIKKPELEEKPKLEEKFFKKMPSEKVPEMEKIPEEILMKKLEEIEARREKERKEREEFLKRVSEEKIEIRPPVIEAETSTRYPLISKIPPKKPVFFEKIFVRIVVVGFLVASWAAIFTFWYWFLAARKPKVIVPPEQPSRIEQPEPMIPPALIPVKTLKIVEFSFPEELKTHLSLFLNLQYPEGQFQRIVIKNKKEMKILTLQEFFETLGIEAPVALYQKLNPDFTLFLYSKEKYNRLGFLTKIKNREGLTSLMNKWEPNMEGDFENLFNLLGKEKPALIPYFRGAQYQGVSFRFQTFTKEDLGICYAIFGDYFIFTSSWESLTKVIDLLK